MPVELPEHAAYLRLLTRGAEVPGRQEQHANPRSASARLRAAERLVTDRGSGMSQLAALRPLPRPTARRPGPLRASSRSSSPPEIQGNGAFLALCVLLLLAGFVGVLMLNTAMAKGSYTMRDLQQRSDELDRPQDSLRHSIDEVSGPGPLAQRARALGMVPAETAAFLRLSDGKVLGVAKKAADEHPVPRRHRDPCRRHRRTTVPSARDTHSDAPRRRARQRQPRTGNPAPTADRHASHDHSQPEPRPAPATTASATTPTGGRNLAGPTDRPPRDTTETP